LLKLWNKAKGIVSKEYGSRKKIDGYWPLVMGITKRMMGMKEALTFKEYLMAEAIKAAEPDEAEESLGWWIVLEKNDKCGWGPFATYQEAVKAVKNHPGYAFHGVPVEKIVYVDHGWCGDDNEFNQVDDEK
jgi:hypothetical protein